jgi:NAD(P)-dependent dehydrogenase (short-subunit alcohol dehydrogenase family)
VEDLALEEVAEQFNTNVFGVFRTIKEVVPIMRRQQQQLQSITSGGGDTIINIGSANGFFGVPCASAYVATKFALEGITQSLRYELAPFEIKVSIIEPGAIKTDVASRNMLIPKKLREQLQLPVLRQKKKESGVISAQLHRGIAGSRVFMSSHVFESTEAIKQQYKNPDFPTKLSEYPASTVTSSHVFKKVAVPGICVE